MLWTAGMRVDQEVFTNVSQECTACICNVNGGDTFIRIMTMS